MPPAFTLSGGNGAPPVVSWITLKLLKLKANDAISSGATATSSSGKTTARNAWNGLAPSTAAASVMSAGIDWSAPRQTRNMYG